MSYRLLALLSSVRCNRSRNRSLQECALQLPRGLVEVSARDDVVTVEDRSRAVTADLHRYALRDARPRHVPNRGAPEVMGNLPRQASVLDCAVPGTTDVFDAFPAA